MRLNILATRVVCVIIVGALVHCAPQSVGSPSVGIATATYLIPASGPPLDAGAIAQLANKTCWGSFDKGANSETARGAVFLRFSSAPSIGEMWGKMGKAAQEAAHRDSPDNYEYMGKTTVPQLTPSGTELIITGNWIFPNGSRTDFEWFLRPISPGNYKVRAVGKLNSGSGAVGEIHCK